MKDKKKLICILALALVLFISAGCIFYGFYSGAIPNAIHRLVKKDVPEEIEETSEPEQEIPEEIPIEEPIVETDKEEIVEEPEITQPDALLNDEITISDTYCIAGDEASFYTYSDDAGEYTWEYYNKKTARWDSVSSLKDIQTTQELDEYYRNVSILNVPAKEDYDGMSFRCVTGQQDPEGSIPDGTLYVIEPFDKLTIPEEYQAGAKELLYTSEIPVTLTYQDNESMEVKGLQGLYFCYEVSSTEDITKDLNEITQTVTTVSKEERSYMTMPGDNPITIRYREGGATQDSDINIIGSDEQAPVIESYEFSEYEVAAADTSEGVEITANIRARDNCTEASRLLYCFALEKEENPGKDEFTQNSSVSIHTNTNGMYAIYVMDEAGNVAKETTELIVVDGKAPKITSVSLEYPDMNIWHESNIIHVSAEDKTDISYQYSCNGTDSGYIRDDFYTVTSNGTWTVTVKDAAGNVTSKEVEITNIDHKPPTILNVAQNSNITRGMSGSLDYSKLIIGYDENGNPIYATDGKDGLNGSDGKTSEQTAQTATPTVVNGKDGIDGKDGVDGKSITGAPGEDGKDGSSVFIRYSENANGANMTVKPTANTKYIGTYSGTKASTNPAQYSWSKYTGEDGNSVFIMYSESPTGENMTETPTSSTKYMGTYTGKSASTNPADYTWAKYKDSSMVYSEEDNTLYIITGD